VAAGFEESFAVTAEGILYTWGTEYVGGGMILHPPPPQIRPTPVAGSLATGARVGHSCSLPRWHSLTFCIGAQQRLGAASPPQSGALHHGVPREMLDAVLAHSVDGDYAHIGEGLLRKLAVRVRKN